MIATKTLVPERKLKIKFTAKRIDTDDVLRPCIVAQQVSLSNGCSMEKTAHSTKKREPVWVVEIGAQKEKRQKIDRSITVQCLAILSKLMTHSAGWVFNQPVDPVALRIPDYFSVILKPMDLGTIKSKLEKNVYVHANEFAADVRLTFSNAMLYNPPGNDVHKMAKDLNQIFERRWKTMEEKYDTECLKFEPEKSSRGPIRIVMDKSASLSNMPVPKKATPSQEKLETVEHMLSGKTHTQKLAKNFNKGAEFGCEQACFGVTTPRPGPTVRKCGDAAHMSSSDMSSDRSLERDGHLSSAASRLDTRTKRTSPSPVRKSDPDSDVSSLDNENAHPGSEAVALVADAVSRQDESTPLGVQLSPQKALRAALLKCRFADTILKAQQKTLDHGDKNDPEKLKKEKERLERRQREEKARIEAEIRAAETATREKAEIELKQQRKRDRDAARVALEKMGRTAEIELNLESLEELEILSGYTPSYHHLSRENGRAVLMASSWPVYTQSPLEQLGLFIKSEYLGLEDENEDEILGSTGEEGEILETN